ncbi:assimilatory sulfite reductase (NADPH) flavoprotein subunit [Paraburkholderia gardini]|uniref:Sulfite reductase [NADPH] flavoprotein alpha-component n=1 Tax=Paraburkholderia gardini TaxID=2823469 RepID=A0ABM8U0E2_9BURK|nr:assimilatory sulfite reductase (NADPH) flavoprotein subunit [Paraburkholderia gardini]CAG4892294.1 Sulfite reductase [NADPH] flavoprotein alpha-component [Paraburkholderia gardini]
MTVSEFRGPGLTGAQWEHISGLASSLDSKQLLWVSGFLAGVEQAATRDVSPLGTAVDASPAPGDAGHPGQRPLTVLYGSETGNSAALATTLAGHAAKRGLTLSLHDMATYKTRQLKDEHDMLIIVSTYGEGDPPQPAAGFFEFVEGRKAPKLPAVRFAVLALGDSTYEHYCEAGKRLDRRLEELGAQRLKPRVDCDIDYDEAASAWIDDIAATLGNTSLTGGKSADGMSSAALPASTKTQTPAFDKRNPFSARIIENIALTGRGSSKETRHIELSLEESGLAFEPGDALGVMPANAPALVETILIELGLAPQTVIDVKGEPVTLGDALANRFEITTLTPRFLDHWAHLSGADALRRLTLADRAVERTDFAHGHHVIDVIRQFPVKGIDAQHLIAGLRPLAPRLYSIASSLAVAPDEVHLTVSTVRYTLHGERRSGIASGHFAERGELDARLPVYVQKNPNFRLPADDVPLIMIGAGTGVAPYRAFMQEREARGAGGRSWLVFGERNFRTDFLYQTEWQTLLKDGVLTRMDVAFSRDRHIEDRAKVYVQHRLKEQARDIFAWLEEGAHVYVCGDANRLAPDVHQALAAVISTEGGLGPAAAEDYLHRLQQDRRYQRDVY